MQRPCKLHQVNLNEDSQRLDNLLLKLIKNIPKQRIYRMIRNGEVRVNMARKKPHYRVQQADIIRIPPYKTPIDSMPEPNQGIFEMLQTRILFEDDQLLVIDKPSGMMVHGNQQQAGLIEHFKHQPSYQHCELAHRLDRETSGCLLIAKKRSTLKTLHAYFRMASVNKRYLALVHGEWASRKRVHLNLESYLADSGEKRVRVNQQGQTAITRFRRCDFNKQVSLLDIKLETGRTHQIRVHCQAVGFPIIGDSKYGNAVADQQLPWHPLRMALHAYEIEFKHPTTQQTIKVTRHKVATIEEFKKNLMNA